MEERKRRPRWSFLMMFIIVLIFNLIILHINDWNIIYTYSFCCNSAVLILVTWAYLFWGVVNFVWFINYNHNEDEEKLQ